MKLTGTFLDEISYDIPHQNWGRVEGRDFAAMRAIGIDTVISFAAGISRITYPSDVLYARGGCSSRWSIWWSCSHLAEEYGMALLWHV